MPAPAPDADAPDADVPGAAATTDGDVPDDTATANPPAGDAVDATANDARADNAAAPVGDASPLETDVSEMGTASSGAEAASGDYCVVHNGQQYTETFELESEELTRAWKQLAAEARVALGKHHPFILEKAVGKGGKSDSGHLDLIARCIVCDAEIKTGGGGGTKPTLSNLLQQHMGFHPDHRWSKYAGAHETNNFCYVVCYAKLTEIAPRTVLAAKGTEHKRRSGDPDAIASIPDADDAQTTKRRRTEPSVSASTASSEASASTASSEAAASADTSAASASAAPSAASASAASSAPSLTRSRCDVFRDVEEPWANDYECDDATEFLMCRICREQRIQLANDAWKAHAMSHSRSCRLKNQVRDSTGAPRVAPAQRRMDDFSERKTSDTTV